MWDYRVLRDFCFQIYVCLRMLRVNVIGWHDVGLNSSPTSYQPMINVVVSVHITVLLFNMFCTDLVFGKDFSAFSDIIISNADLTDVLAWTVVISGT